MAGYTPMQPPPISQTPSSPSSSSLASSIPISVASGTTIETATPSPIPPAHLQHTSNRNIGPIYHHHTLNMNGSHDMAYPATLQHPMHGSIAMQNSLQHHQQQPNHAHHHQPEQQQQQQHHAVSHHSHSAHHHLMVRHHLVGHSTGHNNMLHHHHHHHHGASGGIGNGNGINMTTNIMPLNSSE